MGAHNLSASAAKADVLTDMDRPIDRAGFHESLPLRASLLVRSPIGVLRLKTDSLRNTCCAALHRRFHSAGG